MLIVMVCHVYTCLYYYIKTNYIRKSNLLDQSSYESSHILDNYIKSMYFVVQTITTTGYGDLGSDSNSEMMLRSLYIITGVIIYALCTGEVTDHLTKSIAWKEKINEQVCNLRELHSLYDIDKIILWKVEYELQDPRKLGLLKHTNTGDLIADGTTKRDLDFRNLSKEEIELFYYSVFMQKYKGINMFQTSDSSFILELGIALQKREYKKGHIIYSRDEPAANLFIICEGKVGFMLNTFEDVPFMEIKKGYFGEYELLFNVNRVFSVRALTNVAVYYLETEYFKRIFLKEINCQFLLKLKCKASERENFFNSIHNKFDMYIKNKLSKTKAFNHVKHLLPDTFLTSAKRRSPSKQESKLRISNMLSPLNKFIPSKPGHSRMSLHYSNMPGPSILAVRSKIKPPKAIKHKSRPQPSTSKAYNIEILPVADNDIEQSSEPRINYLRRRVSVSHRRPAPSDRKIQIIEVGEHKSESSDEKSSKSNNIINTETDQSNDKDVYGVLVVKDDKMPKTESKSKFDSTPKNGVRKIDAHVRLTIRKELDPTTPSPSNALFMDFSNLYRSKRHKR